MCTRNEVFTGQKNKLWQLFSLGTQSSTVRPYLHVPVVANSNLNTFKAKKVDHDGKCKPWI